MRSIERCREWSSKDLFVNGLTTYEGDSDDGEVDLMKTRLLTEVFWRLRL